MNYLMDTRLIVQSSSRNDPSIRPSEKAVEAFDIPNIGLSGYEADDCIGTIAKASAQHSRVGILTGDQDMLQLIEENISVLLLKKDMGTMKCIIPIAF